MKRLINRYSVALVLAFLAVIHPGSSGLRNTLQAENLAPSGVEAQASKGVASRPAGGEVQAGASVRQDRLLERETALNLKEQEMKRLGAVLEERIKGLDAARKGFEASLSRKRKEDTENYAKMLKVYKALKPAEAAALIDKLDEDMAIEMLNRMDQKTAVKLIPYLNQARVLKWTRLNLKGADS